jgi:hypothetical protein
VTRPLVRDIIPMMAGGYLYGDSTPSPLKTDFIAFLRDVFDFAVEVLSCDARLADALQRASKLSDATEREIEAAEAFAAEVSEMLARPPVGGPNSLAARCAARIRQGAVDLVRTEADAARAAVTFEKAKVETTAGAERDSCAKAFEALALRHEQPDEVVGVHVRAQDATHYVAQLHGQTPYGLDWIVALEIPPSNALAHVLRIEKVIDRLEVDAPEEAGWIRKETKIRAQRFDRFYLAELMVDPDETVIKLRAAPDGTGGGFDVSFDRETQSVRLVRVSEAGGSSESPYDVAGDGVAKLRALHDAIVSIAKELAAHKKSVVEANLDGTPLQRLEKPRVLADRMLEHIAPTVQEIAKRSLAPTELVVKRLLSDNRREELFLSKAELAQKLEVLAPALRRAFDPLGLFERPPPPKPSASRPPPLEEPPQGTAKVGTPASEGAAAVTAEAPPERVSAPGVPLPLPPRATAVKPPVPPSQAAPPAPRESSRPPRP